MAGREFTPWEWLGHDEEGKILMQKHFKQQKKRICQIKDKQVSYGVSGNCTKEQISKLDYISHYIVPVIAGLGDYLAIVLAEKITWELAKTIIGDRFNLVIPNMYFYIWIPAVFIFFLFYTGAHRRMVPYWETVKNTFYANFYGILAFIFILYLSHQNATMISRLYTVLFFIITFISLCLIRNLIIAVCNKLDILKEPVIFIGAGKTTETIIKFFESNNSFGIKVIGIIDTQWRSDYLKERFRLLKNVNNAQKYVKSQKIGTVIISTLKMDKQQIMQCIKDIQPITKNIMFVTNILGAPVANLEIRRLYTDDILLLNIKNNLADKKNRIVKRLFDIVFGLIICIPATVIILICYVWVKLDSKGPAFFNAKRIGKDGREFTCYKFRSMYMNADEILYNYLAENKEAKKEWDKFQKLHDFDPRVTKAGKIMRKTSLDELPQIFNVLKGEMSLVGPRPYLPREAELMGEYKQIIITTVPGITGYWQVNGRSDVTFEGRLKMDNWYIRNWSVWIDMVLLFKTIKAVFFVKGAT